MIWCHLDENRQQCGMIHAYVQLSAEFGSNRKVDTHLASELRLELSCIVSIDKALWSEYFPVINQAKQILDMILQLRKSCACCMVMCDTVMTTSI